VNILQKLAQATGKNPRQMKNVDDTILSFRFIWMELINVMLETGIYLSIESGSLQILILFCRHEYLPFRGKHDIDQLWSLSLLGIHAIYYGVGD
jgi:hypothetical protein